MHGDSLELAWEVPGELPFPMPIEIQIAGEPHRFEVPGGHGALFIPVGASVEIDPLRRILMEGT